ncbi:hypothetical protein JNM87_06040 [Candidatus Saccharibacteria bacterium]|nr:hypothetical protein [Candidatus Saccharibacteria bacterium]
MSEMTPSHKPENAYFEALASGQSATHIASMASEINGNLDKIGFDTEEQGMFGSAFQVAGYKLFVFETMSEGKLTRLVRTHGPENNVEGIPSEYTDVQIDMNFIYDEEGGWCPTGGNCSRPGGEYFFIQPEGEGFKLEDPEGNPGGAEASSFYGHFMDSYGAAFASITES